MHMQTHKTQRLQGSSKEYTSFSEMTCAHPAKSAVLIYMLYSEHTTESIRQTKNITVKIHKLMSRGVRTMEADPKKQHGTARKEAAQATKATTNHLCGERNNVCFLFWVCQTVPRQVSIKKKKKNRGWRVGEGSCQRRSRRSRSLAWPDILRD